MQARMLLHGVVLLLLTSCGGGGGGSSGPSQAAGLWIGDTSNSRALAGLVVDNNDYYFLCSVAGNPVLIAGLVQGSGTASNGSFSSNNARDFNFEGRGIESGTVSATFVPRSSFNGSAVSSGGGTVTFTTTFDTDYDLTPSLASAAGTFFGEAGTVGGGVESVNFTLNSNGSLSGSSSGGCNFSGTLRPGVRETSSTCRLPSAPLRAMQRGHYF